MNTFYLKILACDRVFYEGEATILVFPVEDGEMAIMAHHEQLMSAVEIGTLRFKTPDGEEHIAIVSDGMITVKKNRAVVLVYSAEKPEEIDAFRAEAALERAREQMQQKQSIIDYHISAASMARAMARLSGKNRGRKT
ncbi:MAG: ATP synthase F1 subunit epsilon [Lachnospiraceae bacterium]|nr:ATP synthase F1 subunit epsilon [Lachnospiraceae bacterium]